MRRRRLASVAIHAALVLLALVAVAPLAWMISASFMAPGEANTYPPPLLPASPTLANYRELFTRLDLGRYALNSLILSAAITAFSVIFNAAASPQPSIAFSAPASAPEPRA